LKDTLEDLDALDEAELAEVQEMVLEILSNSQEPTAGTAYK